QVSPSTIRNNMQQIVEDRQTTSGTAQEKTPTNKMAASKNGIGPLIMEEKAK
ncbi:11225_t:CDS:1, partial [Acaulospora morrowiae]